MFNDLFMNVFKSLILTYFTSSIKCAAFNKYFKRLQVHILFYLKSIFFTLKYEYFNIFILLKRFFSNIYIIIFCFIYFVLLILCFKSCAGPIIYVYSTLTPVIVQQ